MAGANHTTVFDVSLDALWDVITDYEGYADFVEGLEDLKVTKRDGKNVFADYTVSMLGKTVKYSLKHTENAKKSLKWTMVEGDGTFSLNDGGWDLKAKGDDQVEATYTVDVAFNIPIPKFILNSLTSTKLPSMMKAFEDRAKAKSKTKKSAAKGKKK
jgi:ribosome-associated toxin RatA of RatAB toxin-antitoxin module